MPRFVKTAAFLIAILLMLPSTSGIALMAAPTPLTLAVPDEWRDPYVQFLAGLGLKNPKALAASTRFGQVWSVYRPQSGAFRIEDEGSCREDLCLTFIGHLADGHFVADAEFVAGPKIVKSDMVHQIIDMRAWPLLFYGSKETIEIFETAAGWIVIPEK
jgi:hypothetical protein